MSAQVPSDPEPEPSAEPAAAQAEHGGDERDAAPERAEPSEPASDEPRADAPSVVRLCEQLCVGANQMRAVAAEMIEADCARQCEDIDTRAPDPTCAAEAKDVRAKLERAPMHDRARQFWRLLSDPALSCGISDPVLAGLSTAWIETDPVRRSVAFREAALRDPWLSLTCAAGAQALRKPALQSSIDAVVALCPMPHHETGAAIYDDLGVDTFLAVEVVRTHWRALGATSEDHQRLLDIVWLSTALGNE